VAGNSLIVSIYVVGYVVDWLKVVLMRILLICNRLYIISENFVGANKMMCGFLSISYQH